ncbi:sugar phosphate isomerase/epimerase [Actinomyces sp. MRS3W]|uniref:sugar phosphate isomerase/epimerase family protein n=1 Tax=Actinomyces sp. MRS3W TaxID=2800796 RepID=UPI0028FDC0AE|nr:sugar phosphate isomerase/epimerase [Actinomyces sp. MRS3W]MDU0347962.1 sugar phosphate isomerase/epimerase [Actinomyces sp. MRS3W]
MPISTAQPSVQLYAVRDALSHDLEGTLARVADIGYTQVEAFAFVEQAPRLRRALDAAGLTAPTAHASIIDVEDPEPVLAAAQEIGVELLIDPFLGPDLWRSAGAVARLADKANTAAERAAQAGLALGYHNHSWETSTMIAGRHALEVFADALEPGVALEVDTFWATFGGADAPALLRRLGDRVRAIHVKDGVMPATPPQLPDDVEQITALMAEYTARQQPAGAGDVDVAAALRAAPQALRVVEFDDYAGDIFEGIAASLAWLREHDV